MQRRDNNPGFENYEGIVCECSDFLWIFSLAFGRQLRTEMSTSLKENLGSETAEHWRKSPSFMHAACNTKNPTNNLASMICEAEGFCVRRVHIAQTNFVNLFLKVRVSVRLHE